MSTDLDPEVYNTMMASLEADLAAWTEAPTVPVDFDPRKPVILTPGGGLTLGFSNDGLGTPEAHYLEPDDYVSYACGEEWGRPMAARLGGPWKLVPVAAIREERIKSLTGAIEHLKGYAPPDVAPSNVVDFED